MKKNLLFFFVLFFLGNINAQQEVIFSQYHLNRFLINPAAAGSSNQHTVFSNLRFQWTGLPRSPKTGLLSYHGKFNNIGLGAMVFSDRIASLDRFGINFAYAYHARIQQSNLSVGFSGQYQKFRLERNAMAGVEHQDDLLLHEAMDGLNVYDATLGIYYYNYKFYMGFSVPNIIQSKLNAIETGINSTPHLTRQYLFTVGYKYFPEKSFFSVEPSLLLRKITAAPFRADLTLKVGMMDEKLFTAFTYGTSELIIITTGFQMMESVRVAYSFDYSLGELYRYTKGSHEISFFWEIGKKYSKNGKPEMLFKG